MVNSLCGSSLLLLSICFICEPSLHGACTLTFPVFKSCVHEHSAFEHSIWTTRGQRSGSSRDSLATGEGAERGTWERRGRGGGMQWSAVTWCSASPIMPAGARTQGGTAEAVPSVFNRASPQAPPEAPLGVS